MKDKNITAEVQRKAIAEKKPNWCTLPEANSFMGCWSLYFGLVKDKSYCKECEYCENEHYPDIRHYK